VDAGDERVRDVVYPVASQATVRDLVAELKSSGPTYRRTLKAHRPTAATSAVITSGLGCDLPVLVVVPGRLLGNPIR
jgi:hypothetical protein